MCRGHHLHCKRRWEKGKSSVHVRNEIALIDVNVIFETLISLSQFNMFLHLLTLIVLLTVHVHVCLLDSEGKDGTACVSSGRSSFVLQASK